MHSSVCETFDHFASMRRSRPLEVRCEGRRCRIGVGRMKNEVDGGVGTELEFVEIVTWLRIVVPLARLCQNPISL